MKISDLIFAVQLRLSAHNVKPGTRKAALIESEFLIGVNFTLEANKQQLNPGVMLCVMSGRSILTLNAGDASAIAQPN
jgi:hypothetical protein